MKTAAREMGWATIGTPPWPASRPTTCRRASRTNSWPASPVRSPTSSSAQSGQRAAVVRGVVAAEDDLAGRLKTIPYAAYDGRQMMVAYAKGEMWQDDKLMVMRGNNRHFMRLVTPHELIPGHHLQAFYAARGPHRPFPPRSTWKAGPCIGNCGCGTWAGRNARRSHRHALLADEPLGPRDPHAEVSPGPHDAGGNGRVPYRPRGAREVRRPRRSPPLHPGRPCTRSAT